MSPEEGEGVYGPQRRTEVNVLNGTGDGYFTTYWNVLPEEENKSRVGFTVGLSTVGTRGLDIVKRTGGQGVRQGEQGVCLRKDVL